MLDKLFGSNSRVKLLKLFFLNPRQRFYIREIARHLGLQLNSVYRELNNLEEIGMLNSEAGPDPDEELQEVKEKKLESKKQDKKYYRLNPDFIFLNEIQALIIKSQMLYEKDFTDKIKKVGDVKLLILTGIFVNKADSTIDLLAVGEFNKKKFLAVIAELEKELVKEINYSLMSEQDFNDRREITDMFLFNILDGEKIIVVDEKNLFT